MARKAGNESVNRRLPKLTHYLAAIYLLFSLTAFFGSLGSESHSWWPILLYYPIWPLSWLYEAVSKGWLERMIPEPRLTPVWVWTLNDYIAGAFYVLAGTAWIWSLGKGFSALVTRCFPRRSSQSPNPTHPIVNDRRLPAWLRCWFQAALVGEIYPAIRAIAVGFSASRALTVRMYLDREPTPNDKENLSIIMTEVFSNTQSNDDITSYTEQCVYSNEPMGELDSLDGFV